MSGRFETLIYTDCRRGDGLLGTAGLQFQARSPAADREAMSVVQRDVLYEPPAKWMRERRPVSAYPPSFAHVYDGWYATARGIYLGKEVNGGREGNQLTHSIASRDAAAYGAVRPAQLFDAPFWTDTPAPTAACEPLNPGWEPGLFDAVQAQEYVKIQTGGADMLVALVSALETALDAGGQRVLFIAEDVVPVMQWLTAATLLLPQERALRIGFKVFTTNPAYATQQVLAVHPDWGSSAANVHNDLGYAVFDLVEGSWSDVEPSPGAHLWVRMFCDEDPYDVVDAVEVAAATGLPVEQAAVLAVTAVMERTPSPRDANMVIGWLCTGPADLVDAYGPRIVDLFLQSAADWPADVLVGLDLAVREGRLRDQSASVRLTLLATELARARDQGIVETGSVPPLSAWSAKDEATATRMLADALRGASSTEFATILRIAARFGVPVPMNELRDATRAFILDWADHPEWSYEPKAFANGQHMEELLRAELNERLRQDPLEAHAIGDAWWAHFRLRTGSIDSMLDEQLLAAAMVSLDQNEEDRRQLVEESLAGARNTADPARAVQRAVSALWQRSLPALSELEQLCRLIPPNTALDQQVFAVFADRLANDERVTAGRLDIARRLVDHGFLHPSPKLAQLLAVDRSLGELCAALPAAGDDDPAELVLRLRAISARVVHARRDHVVAALLQTPRPHLVSKLLETAPVLAPRYAHLLGDLLWHDGEPHQAVTAFYLGLVPGLSEELLAELIYERRRRLTYCAQYWVTEASRRKLRQANEQMKQLGAEWAKTWREMVRHNRGRQRGIGLLRPFGG